MNCIVEGLFAKFRNSKKEESRNNKVWLVPSNINRFDLKDCFNEFREVYWAQYFKFQTGDTIYIYSASPECYIKYKAEVIGHDMPFDTKIERQRKYMKDPKIFNKYVIHNRFALLKLVDACRSDCLSYASLTEHGLKFAPRGANKLSGELLKYIETNF